ncbi:MAG: hypothetical protein AB1758_05750 [Candidatus Eremiobacterota bacterium]
MRAFAMVALILVLAGPARAEISDQEFHEFVFFACLEGLYHEGLPDDAVDGLLVRDSQGQLVSFVYACPICHPVYDALALYRQRQVLLGSKSGSRDFRRDITQAELAELRSQDPARRTAALGALVRKWVDRKVEASRWTPAERAAWDARFEEAREQGERQLKAYQKLGMQGYSLMKSCKLCDGANEGLKP